MEWELDNRQPVLLCDGKNQGCRFPITPRLPALSTVDKYRSTYSRRHTHVRGMHLMRLSASLSLLFIPLTPPPLHHLPSPALPTTPSPSPAWKCALRLGHNRGICYSRTRTLARMPLRCPLFASATATVGGCPMIGAPRRSARLARRAAACAAGRTPTTQSWSRSPSRSSQAPFCTASASGCPAERCAGEMF